MKVINFFGAPGAGKSTATSGLFHEMKKQWIDAELVTEFAKELVWAGSAHMLAQQHYVFSNQEHRQNRLINKVDVALSDAPLLLSVFYAPPHYPLSFKQMVFDFFDRYENINLFINRSHEYSGMGRLQNEAQSDAIATSMKQFLRDHGVPFYEITANDAAPRYLLHWLVEQGFVRLPDTMPALPEGYRPPPGWIMPVLQPSAGHRAKALERSYLDHDVPRVAAPGVSSAA